MDSLKEDKKRKQAPLAATTSEAPSKKLKKQAAAQRSTTSGNTLASELSPSTATVSELAEVDATAATKKQKIRKRAADFLSDHEEDTAVKKVQTKSAVDSKKRAKRAKAVQKEIVEAGVPQVVAVVTSGQKPAKATSDPGSKPLASSMKKTKPNLANGDALSADGVNGILEHSTKEDVGISTANKAPSTSMQAEAQRTVDKEMALELGTEDESDEQGAALLAGFDSESDDMAEDTGLDPANMADLNLSKQQRKKLRQATRKDSKEGPGTVYVGRIPRGFYEVQMRQYFSQFGTITNLRLSRNKTTGASKHFAFVEFESNEVAKIVAQTMDNYLMFGHILKCKYAPSEALHPDTWKGANKRFKRIPHNKIEKRKLEEPKTKDKWEKKISREQEKREKKLARVQAMGYDYQLPQIQGVEAALARKQLTQTHDLKEIEPSAEVKERTAPIEEATEVQKDGVAPKPKQKSKKGANGEPVGGIVATATPAAMIVPPKFAFHPDEIAEHTQPDTTDKGAEKVKKTKKADHVAAQMQLNNELHAAVKTDREEIVESDAEITATTAVLPTPGGRTKKAEKKAKKGKRTSEPVIEAEAEEVSKKVKKTKKNQKGTGIA